MLDGLKEAAVLNLIRAKGRLARGAIGCCDATPICYVTSGFRPPGVMSATWALESVGRFEAKDNRDVETEFKCGPSVVRSK